MNTQPNGMVGRNLLGKLIGKYRIMRQIGSGGMGAIYEAVHEDIGQRAAVKVLHVEYGREPRYVDRFLAEGRAASSVAHPGLVKVFDLNQLDDGMLYILMEFLEGESLSDRLRRTSQDRSPASVRDALRIARSLASALAAVHKKGIVHRDLKPDNVILVHDPDAPSGERPKILDFGIAKFEAGGCTTTAGLVMGTAAYMAPEQCEGRHDVGDRADVYALGVMVYEMLAGAPPFAAEAGSVLMRHHMFRAPPPLPPCVPQEAAALVMEMLTKDAAARMSMTDVVARIDGLAAVPSPPYSQQAITAKRPSILSRRPAARLMALFLLFLTAGLGWRIYKARRQVASIPPPVQRVEAKASTRPPPPPGPQPAEVPVHPASAQQKERAPAPRAAKRSSQKRIILWD